MKFSCPALAAAALTVWLAGCSTTSVYHPVPVPGSEAASGPASTRGSANIGPCQAAQLKLERAGNDAGMGHRRFGFRFTNISDNACQLGGYPQVQALDSANKVSTDINVIHATHSYLVPKGDARTQALAPGTSLWFVVTWSVIPHGNQPCPGMAALRIAPPLSGATPALAGTPQAPAGNTDVPQPAPATTTGTVFPQVSSVCDGLRVLPLRAAPPGA